MTESHRQDFILDASRDTATLSCQLKVSMDTYFMNSGTVLTI